MRPHQNPVSDDETWAEDKVALGLASDVLFSVNTHKVLTIVTSSGVSRVEITQSASLAQNSADIPPDLYQLDLTHLGNRQCLSSGSFSRMEALKNALAGQLSARTSSQKNSFIGSGTHNRRFLSLAAGFCAVIGLTSIVSIWASSPAFPPPQPYLNNGSFSLRPSDERHVGSVPNDLSRQRLAAAQNLRATFQKLKDEHPGAATRVDKPVDLPSASAGAEDAHEGQDDAAKQKLLATLRGIRDAATNGQQVTPEMLSALPKDIASKIVASATGQNPENSANEAVHYEQASRGSGEELPASVIAKREKPDQYGISDLPTRNSWSGTSGNVVIPLPGGGDIKNPSDLSHFGIQP